MEDQSNVLIIQLLLILRSRSHGVRTSQGASRQRHPVAAFALNSPILTPLSRIFWTVPFASLPCHGPVVDRLASSMRLPATAGGYLHPPTRPLLPRRDNHQRRCSSPPSKHPFSSSARLESPVNPFHSVGIPKDGPEDCSSGGGMLLQLSGSCSMAFCSLTGLYDQRKLAESRKSRFPAHPNRLP